MSILIKSILGLLIGGIVGAIGLSAYLHYDNYQKQKYRREKESRNQR